MEEVKLKLNETGQGMFYIEDGKEQLGRMEISIQGSSLIVYHTEVEPKAEGKGFAKNCCRQW